MRALIVLFAVLLSSSALAQVKFRVPLSLLDTQCNKGRCYPTAYYDTNRSASWLSDWGCGVKTYNQHDGIDYGIGGWAAMDEGRWVMAAAAGTVIAVHDGEFDRCYTGNCGTANYIMIQHSDGKVTWYWHLKKWSIRVKKGDKVKCGQVIANVGSSGLSTGPHLHFGVFVPGYGMDDPYGASSGACGGTATYWMRQGGYGALPGLDCQ